MAKKVKPAVEPIKEKEIEPPEIISSALSVDELKMKDLMWSMKLVVHHIMPKSYHDFSIRFVFDEEPYKREIKMIEEKMAGNTNLKLFPEMNKADIDDLREEIEDIKKGMAIKAKECETIEFIGQVEELKYSGADTILKVRIPDHVIEPINEVKMRFGYYKVELQAQV